MVLAPNLKLHSILLLLPLLIISSPVFSTPISHLGYGNDAELIYLYAEIENPNLKNALQIKGYINKRNLWDLQTLNRQLRDKVQKKHVHQALKKLHNDKRILKSYYEQACKLPINTHTLLIKRTIETLIPFKGDPGSYGFAINLLEQWPTSYDLDTGQYKKRAPVNHEISFLKLALLYLYAAVYDRENMQSLPIKIRESLWINLPFSPKKPILLLDKSRQKFLFPHAGYVNWGTATQKDDVLCYVDCAKFISLSLNLPVRLFTEDYEKIYLSLGRSYYPLPNKLKNLKKYFIRVDRKKIQQGDIVLWRWEEEDTSEGHIAFFIKWHPTKADSFYGVDATRLADHSLEGVGLRLFAYERPKAKTYILRYKAPDKKTT